MPHADLVFLGQLIKSSKVKTADLAHYNRHLLAPGIPRRKKDQRDAELIASQLDAAQERDGLRQGEWQRRQDEAALGAQVKKGGLLGSRTAAPSDTSRFTFEDDDGEQEQMIRDDDADIDEIAEIAGRVHLKMVGLGKQIDASNTRLGETNEKVSADTSQMFLEPATDCYSGRASS